MNRYDPQHTDLLAAEYVLGTLQGAARRRFERWLSTDPQLQHAVQGWELRLNTLADTATPLTPPAELWSGLEQRLFAERQPISAPVPVPLWQRLGRQFGWPTLAIGSSLAAAVLAVMLVVRPSAPTTSDYIVLIQNQSQQPIWAATAAADFSQLRVRNVKPMDIPQGRGCLLWVQPAGSNALYPLGMLPDDGSTIALNVSDQLRNKIMNGKLVVSIEDSELRPTEPTNSVDYTGRIVALEGGSI